MITRDSWVLILLIVGSIAGYFATLPDPRTWAWPQWMNCLVVVTGLIAAKLSTSKLAGEKTPISDSRLALGGILKLTDRG